MDRENGGGHGFSSSTDGYVDDASNPYASPSAKPDKKRIGHSARSSIWGRPWETPVGILLSAPPGDAAAWQCRSAVSRRRPEPQQARRTAAALQDGLAT